MYCKCLLQVCGVPFTLFMLSFCWKEVLDFNSIQMGQSFLLWLVHPVLLKKYLPPREKTSNEMKIKTLTSLIEPSSLCEYKFRVPFESHALIYCYRTFYPQIDRSPPKQHQNTNMVGFHFKPNRQEVLTLKEQLFRTVNKYNIGKYIK